MSALFTQFTIALQLHVSHMHRKPLLLLYSSTLRQSYIPIPRPMHLNMQDDKKRNSNEYKWKVIKSKSESKLHEVWSEAVYEGTEG